MQWWQHWTKRRTCFHHQLPTYDRNSQQWLPGESWIKSQLIETGKAKMFWCTECEKTWLV
jgi:hypothetical protein